jgi:Uma2 family endonuclease
MLGRDFVIRLDDNGLTPDLIFIDPSRLANLHDYYLDGPPALAIEITLAGSADLDRQLKRQLYEAASLPEYWLIEPDPPHITFYHLEAEGRYHALTVDRQGRYLPTGNGRHRPVSLDQDGVYHSPVVPDLALSVPRLWAMTEHNWAEP